jgi:hypothetical protein
MSGTASKGASVIDLVKANEAYDICGSGRVLLCFCREEDIAHVRKPLDKLSTAMKIIRVEPGTDSAVELQLIKFPSFILYADGSEVFNVVGADVLMGRLSTLLR